MNLKNRFCLQKYTNNLFHKSTSKHKESEQNKAHNSDRRLEAHELSMLEVNTPRQQTTPQQGFWGWSVMAEWCGLVSEWENRHHQVGHRH